MKLNLLSTLHTGDFCNRLLIGIVLGQAPGTGAIKGRCHDPSGAIIQNARVTVVNEATDTKRVGSTDATGAFSFPLLAPGTYIVTVESAGFSDGDRARPSMSWSARPASSTSVFPSRAWGRRVREPGCRARTD